MNYKGQVKFKSLDNKAFFQVLRSRIDQYFAENQLSKNGNTGLYLKAILLIAFYLLPYFAILAFAPPVWVQYLLWIIGGIALAGIGMNVMHDAIHESFSSKKWVNKMAGLSLNLLGCSIFNWKNQHNILHHTYTNITPYDEDIDGVGILRFSPHRKSRKMHQFQWTYVAFFYSILTIYWLVAKDFFQFFNHIRKGVNNQSFKSNAIQLTRIVAVKVFYFTYMFVIPIAFFEVNALHWTLGVITMLAVSGLILSFVFQLAHTVETTSFPKANAQGEIENQWAVHQLCTTVNFSRNKPIISWYVGGLNYQVEHHLFPRISHVHYPNIAPIVKQTAEEFNVPYMENKNLIAALASHFRFLKKIGTRESFEHLYLEN